MSARPRPGLSASVSAFSHQFFDTYSKTTFTDGDVQFSSVQFSSILFAIPYLHMYSAARRTPHAHIITGTLWVLGSGFWADGGGGGGEGGEGGEGGGEGGEEGGEGAKGVKGEKGAGYSSNAGWGWTSCGRRAACSGQGRRVRGSWFVVRGSCHRERGTDARLRAYAHALPFQRKSCA